MVEIQFQVSGVWQTYSYVINDPQFYLVEMRNAQQAYPTRRIRAIDETGHLLDML